MQNLAKKWVFKACTKKLVQGFIPRRNKLVVLFLCKFFLHTLHFFFFFLLVTKKDGKLGKTWENAEIDDFDHRTACEVPICWLKNSTG